MRRALVSPLMLYHYDQDLFAGLTIPEQLDKDILVNNLLAETAEMEVIYPDPEIFKQMVEFWSASRIHTWERIANVLYEEYDPFINIKRDEVRTIESSGTNENAVSAWNEKTYQNRDGRKEFSGDLAGYEDGAVLLTVGKETMRFEKAEVALVRLRVEF